METAPVPKRTSLSRALAAIAEIINIAAEGLNDDEAINNCLAIADSELSSCVDRRIGLVTALSGGSLSVESAKGLISSMKAKEEEVRHERKMLEKILLRIKETTLSLMEENGVSILRGSTGEFKLQDGAPSLICDIPVYAKSYSNLVKADDSLNVPLEYLTYEQIATLNKDMIKEDLKHGKVLEWARLIYNKQIRMKQTPPSLR